MENDDNNNDNDQAIELTGASSSSVTDSKRQTIANVRQQRVQETTTTTASDDKRNNKRNENKNPLDNYNDDDSEKDTRAKNIFHRLWKILTSESNPTEDTIYVKIIQDVEDFIVSMIIGFFAVSYWRGTWTFIDIISICDQEQDATIVDGTIFCFSVEATTSDDDNNNNNDDYSSGADNGTRRDNRVQSAIVTYVVGVILTFFGNVVLLWIMSVWHPRPNKDGVVTTNKIKNHRILLRITTIYILGLAAVCQWRGIWYLTDDILKDLPLDDDNLPLISYWVSCLVGYFGALCLLCSNSLLAPPAIFLLDGPSVNPPPIGVTIVSSYYSLTRPCNNPLQPIHTIVEIIDAVLSFVILPWFVVFYWRGCW